MKPVIAAIAVLVLPQLDVAIARYDHRVATAKVTTFCRMLGCPVPAVVVVHRVMPNDSIIAHTTREIDGDRCVLHFTRESVQVERHLAHEACHCAQDWEQLGPWGWRYNVSMEERKRREVKARACEQRVMSGTVAPELRGERGEASR